MTTLNEQLMEAVKNGDAAAVRRLLAAGADAAHAEAALRRACQEDDAGTRCILAEALDVLRAANAD